MAVAPTDGFRSSAPSGTAAFSGASPSAYGAEVGQGMARLGAQLHQDDVQMKALELERQRDAEAARAGRGLAQLGADMDAWTQDARLNRRNDDNEALGHSAAWQQEFEQRAGAFLETIGNDQVREQYSVRLADMGARGVGQERGWEQGQRAGAQARNSEDAVRIQATTLATRPFSLADLDGAVADMNANLTLQVSLSPEVRDDARRQFSRTLALAAIDAGTEQNPQAMLTLIRGGQFNNYGLTAEDIRQRGNVAEAAVHAVETQARQEQAAAREQFGQDMQLLDRRFEDGDPTLTLAEVTAMGQRAASLGIRPEVYDAARYEVRLQVQHQYRTTNALGLRQAIGALDARIQSAGDHASPADVIGRTELEHLLERRTRIEQSDPLRVSGAAIGALDGSPASIRARVGAARTAEAQTGHFQYYTPQELPRLQELAGSGPQGRLAAANEVAAIGAVDPRAADAAARQVLPNDATFRMAVRQAPAIRAQVLSGAEARRQLPQMTLADGSKTSFDEASQRWFRANIQPQLRGLNQEDVNGVLEAARAVYAERARQHGNLANPGFDQGTFGEAVSDVLGRSNQGGGTGFWDFGANGQTLTSGRRPGVVLPARMTQQRFDTVMTWIPIARLNEPVPPGAMPNGGAIWSNRSPVSVDDIRGRFVPVMVDDGVYEFHGPDGSVLGAARGGHFRLDVYALEAHGAPPRHGPPPDPALQRQLEAGRSEYDRRRRQAGN